MLKEIGSKLWEPKRKAESVVSHVIDKASGNGNFYAGMLAVLFIALLADFWVFGFRLSLFLLFLLMVLAVFLNLRLLKRG